jgi:coenzyme F420-0:L-glutamate ligase
MNVRPVKTRIFKEGEDLLSFIIRNVPKLQNGSILVVTSKIVALAEGRTADVKDFNKIVRAESAWALKTKYVWLTEKDGMILANAGVDESNANGPAPRRSGLRPREGGKLILLPKDSFATAQKLRSSLLSYYAKASKDKQKTAIKKLGVIITDSRVTPLRAGVVGVALGYAGFKGLRDYRGKKDISGRKLKFTQTDVADSLATAATLVMGEGSERQPLAVITDALVEWTGRVNKRELLIPLKDDMYAPLFRKIRRR